MKSEKTPTLQYIFDQRSKDTFCSAVTVTHAYGSKNYWRQIDSSFLARMCESQNKIFQSRQFSAFVRVIAIATIARGLFDTITLAIRSVISVSCFYWLDFYCILCMKLRLSFNQKIKKNTRDVFFLYEKCKKISELWFNWSSLDTKNLLFAFVEYTCTYVPIYLIYCQSFIICLFT